MERLWAPQRDLQRFLEWVVPHRFFAHTDRQLEAEGVHRWRYNEVAIAQGLHAELHTPLQALAHPYFRAFRDALAPAAAPAGLTAAAGWTPPLKAVGHPLNFAPAGVNLAASLPAMARGLLTATGAPAAHVKAPSTPAAAPHARAAHAVGAAAHCVTPIVGIGGGGGGHAALISGRR